MPNPRVPDPDPGEDGGDSGGDDQTDDGFVDLPCGERVHVQNLDMGMREYECVCGSAHAVVMDMHPPSRWFPESIVAVLEETVEPSEDDEFETFGTPHLMGAVLEEFPDDVVAYDASKNGAVGAALVWLTDFDARTLHEYVVELVVELMEHAVSHSESGASEFEEQMMAFDVAEFVDEYREAREFEDEYDTPA
ncbi:DUF5815 family protein [Halospeciosus flavus]|uniref:DUF5815 family protein n=1 Tax=Halospeciosus flavus TaxID=3032283 RepID=A0ABD5Z8L8_9EURY|nr:DUF5815 family protein [Halospeciosus flavus]